MPLRYFIVFLLLPSSILASSFCKKTESIRNKKISHWECCDGYKSVGLNCEPICREDCGHGKCVSPNTCSCHEGYDNFQHDSAYGCVPVCKRGCQGGECVAPETCRCYTGYKLEESTGQCAPICSGGCRNGRCESPGRCVCNEGYSEGDEGCQPVCAGDCGANSRCVAPNKCNCVEGYAEINQKCLPREETIHIANNTNTTEGESGIQDAPSIEDKMTDVIGFLRHWMIELLVVLAFVIILIMALWILISKVYGRNYDVAQRERDRPVYAYDNEMDVLEVVSGPVYNNTIKSNKY
ncbi:hypothetical protein ACLKA7_004564 [Drosophila subpalustris]